MWRNYLSLFSYTFIGELVRIEKVYDKLYIYLDKLYVDCDYSDKKSVGEFVKDYLFRYSKYLDLYGFYKVKVYCNELVGLFYTEVVDKVNLLDFCNYIYGDKILEVKNRGLYIKKESN